MNKKLFFSVVLIMALVFGIVGCDNDPSGGNGGDVDTWSDVTSLSQINGSWKAPSSFSYTIDGMTYTTKYDNYIVTFNAAAKTMSVSGSFTATISGGNINEYWLQLKEGLELPQGITATFNNASHSYTITYNNYSGEVTDEIIVFLSYKINQNRSKLKRTVTQGTEIILTKL